MDVNDYDLELEDLYRRSALRLHAAETFDAAAFAALREYICRKAEMLRDEYVISKQLLKCLRDSASIIRSQAEYVPAARDNLQVANGFDMLLDLLIAGEGCFDRQPGVPRTI